MTTAATGHRASPRGNSRGLFGCGLALVAAIAASPAAAQVGGSLAVANDERLRGHSISGDRPVTELELSYDHRSGVYAGGSATVVLTRDDDVRLLGIKGYLGYARRTSGGLVIDIGGAWTHYTEYGIFGRPVSYAEAYIGIAGRHLSGRIFYSPDYLRNHRSTVYAELDWAAEPAPDWQLTAHVGALRQIGGAMLPGRYRMQCDWQLGVGRRIGRLDAQLALVGASRDYQLYVDTHRSTALVLRLSYAL